MLHSITQSANYKWWVFGSIAIGTFLSVVDHGSVSVALPDIESHFDSNLATVQWVVVGYALAISVFLLPMGRLGDIIGRKPVYIGGFAIFVLFSALAGLSTNLPTLVGAKVLQGAGSAMIQGTGMATIISAFPASERGKALGYHISIVGVGAIAGPALGGLLTSTLGWRWVFFINVPIGLISIAASLLILGRGRSAPETQGGPRPAFDWLGAALSGGVLLLLLLVVSNGHRIGWTQAPIVLGTVGFLVLLAAFIWWELRAPWPMLELRLFKRKLVSMGVAAGWLAFLVGGPVRFLMPFYLQKVLGYSPGEVGAVLIPGAICVTILGPISGRLSDRFGWRRLTTGGLIMTTIPVFVLAITLTEHTALILIISMLVIQSAGFGLFSSPNNSSVFSAVEQSRYGVVSAVTQLVRNTANVTGIALATTVVVVTMGSRGVEPSLDAVSPQVASAFIAGLHRAFMLLGALLVVGVAIAFLRGERVKETPVPTPRMRVSEDLPD